MPEKETIEQAREDEREGKSPSTQAGEFVREEMEHIREGGTWCAVAGTGDCHWAIQGEEGWREVASAQARQSTNKTAS